MSTFRRMSLAERLAAAAALAATASSLAGFLPGLYRDPSFVVGQSHGYDAGNLVAVAVLVLGLARSSRGSARGRLVTSGALACLLYGYVTYAFFIVLNPATLLYIAVLGLGGWSFALGLARVSDHEVGRAIDAALPRKATASFLIVAAALFALNWLRLIAGSVISGRLPPELEVSGWPMNPVFVLDLGFVLPFMVFTAVRIAKGRPGAGLLAAPLLVFQSVLGITILLMAIFAAAAGQALEPLLLAIFVVVTLASASMAWLALR